MGILFSQMALNILHIPVNFGCEIGHLWYIYMLIGLYLVTPIISPWLQQASKRELEGYLGLWIITTFLPYIHLVYPEVLGEAFWNDTPLLYYFTGFIGYFILGYYLKRFGYPSAALSWIILIVGFALSAGIFCSRIDTVPTVPELELSWGFCTVNVFLMTLGPLLSNRPIIFKREKCSLQTAVGYIDKKLWNVLSPHSVSKFLLWTIQVYLGCGLCHNSLDRRVYIYYGLHIRIFVILPAQKQVYHRIIYKTCHQ